MEWLDQDYVGVYVVGEYDEVVAAAGADRETTHVVGVELSCGIYPDIEFFGFGLRVSWCRWFGQRCNIGGADALARLLGMALESFHGDRAILGRVLGGEAWPGILVTWFDGS